MDIESIISAAADKSLGFGPSSGRVTVDIAEILLVASRAAYHALELAGVIRAEESREKASKRRASLDSQGLQYIR